MSVEFQGCQYNQVRYTSDNHFGHANIMRFCPKYRPYESVAEMNRALVEYHNATVDPFDLTVFIGDFSFLGAKETIEILKSMSGSKVLILGNHDMKNLRSGAFNRLGENVHTRLSLPVGDQHLVLDHFPLWEWDRMHRGAIHLHGHVHGKPVPVPGRILDVGWDAHGKYLTHQEVLDLTLCKEVRKH